MYYQFLSPLAVVCALAFLYPPANHANGEVCALAEDFAEEEFSLEAVFEEGMFALSDEEEQNATPQSDTAQDTSEEQSDDINDEDTQDEEESSAAAPTAPSSTMPQQGSGAPAKPNAMPQPGSETSTMPGATPQQDSGPPAKPNAMPQQDSGTSTMPGATPQQGSGVPAKPQQGSATSTMPSATPQQGSGTPAKPQQGSATSTMPGATPQQDSGPPAKPQTGSMSLSKQPLADPALLSTNTPAAPQEVLPMSPHSSFTLGGSYSYVHIKPHRNPSLHGSLGGMQALYEYRPMNQIYGSGKVSWRQGQTEGPSTTRFLVDATVEPHVGYTLSAFQDRWAISFFSGVGYRYLGHHVRQAHHQNLRFNYSEIYIPVGLASTYKVNEWFSWGFNATWMPQVWSFVPIRPLKGAYWSLTRTYANTLLELPLSFNSEWFPSLVLTVKPSFQYWQDGHSTAQASTGETLGLHGNNYYFWGVDLNLSYSF